MANVKNPKWQQRFIDLAETFSTWSKDPSTRVGAVIVTESCKIVGQGYNGLLPGINDELLQLGREFKIDNTAHAEANAFTDNTTHTNEDLYLFVSKPICLECAKLAALNKIKGVFCLTTTDPTFNKRWNNDRAQMVLANTNITYTEITN